MKIAVAARSGGQGNPLLTSSAHTLKLFSVLGPNVLLIATSARFFARIRLARYYL